MSLSARDETVNADKNGAMCERLCESEPDPASELPASPAPAGNIESPGAERQPHPTDPKRWLDGTWRTGDGALTHGVRRYELRGVLPEATATHVNAFHAGVLSDLGGESEATAIKAGYARRLSQVEGALELLGDDIGRNGVMTQRGRPRSAFTLYLRTLEVWDRYAQRLGIERRQKPALTPAEYWERKQREDGA